MYPGAGRAVRTGLRARGGCSNIVQGPKIQDFSSSNRIGEPCEVAADGRGMTPEKDRGAPDSRADELEPMLRYARTFRSRAGGRLSWISSRRHHDAGERLRLRQPAWARRGERGGGRPTWISPRLDEETDDAGAQVVAAVSLAARNSSARTVASALPSARTTRC